MVTRLQRAGLPHSEIIGSKPVCSYPMLIAAYHVLLRLQKPRHPPSALVTFVSVSLDTFESQELSCLHLFSCFVCLWNCSPQLDSDFSRSPDSLFFRYRLSFSIFYLVISLNIVKQLFFVYFERVLRWTHSSVAHYHQVTHSFIARPPCIHLKIFQRTFRFYLKRAAKIRTFS